MSVLHTIQIENVRNIAEISLKLNPRFNIFVGKNGVGKTSVLEAIHLLAMPKSFRTAHLKDVIGFNKQYFRIRGTLLDETTIEIGYEAQPTVRRILKANENTVTLQSYLRLLPIVTFTPQDIHMLELGPALRRNFLDKVLSKIDFEYLHHLTRYEKTLASRNSLLRKISHGEMSKADLSPWDTQLAVHGAVVIRKRCEFIAQLTKIYDNLYKEISQSDATAQVRYLYKDETMSHTDDSGSSSEKLYDEISEEQLYASLQLRQAQDIQSGTTSVGPHRDDLLFTLNGKNAQQFSSRGEARTLILCLKIGEIELVQESMRTPPIILLDDVFSELDTQRQNQLLHAINGHQVCISTNSIHDFEDLRDTMTIFEMPLG